MRWTGHVVRIGGMRNIYRIFVWIFEGKRLLRLHDSKWESNIKMDFKEIHYNFVD